VYFEVRDQPLFSQILEKMWEYNRPVQQPFTDSEKAYDSVRREVLHSTLTEYGTAVKLVTLIKIYLK